MNRLLASTCATRARLPGKLTVIAALLATLAAPALAESNVVISQIYGGGGNSGAPYKNDFVELFNRSGASVDLTGWAVQYASAGGSSWTVTPLGARSLAPGQYLLVKQGGGANGVDLPAHDVSGTTSMGATAGKVALTSSTGALSGASPSSAALVELIGFGSSASAYETAPAPAPSAANAILRANGGCTDADHSGTDFATGAPAPRNSASPPNLCGGPVVHAIVTSCPAGFALAQGSAGSVALAASDVDGVVNGAEITGGAVAGIGLGGFSASAEAGAAAGVTLDVGAGVAVGNYPVVVRFSNDQAQSSSCTVNVSVQGLAAVSASIPQIQGAGAASPLAATVQTTEGVVTLKVGTGFFIQDAAGDNDPSTSDGLFVYTGSSATSVAVGDLARVTGTVTEYTPSGASRSYTELTGVTSALAVSSGHAVTPANVELPNANLADLEGMLVRFTSALTVSQSAYVAARGELSLSSGRLEIPTNRHRAGSPEALALAAANKINKIVLDDGIFVTPASIPYLDQDNTVRVGDTVSDLTGVVDFGAIGGGGASFKLQPTAVPLFSRANPRTEAPSIAQGNVRVASANVLNFFTTFTNGADAFGATSGQGCTIGTSNSRSNCRGADNLAEFVRQRDKIVQALKAIDADVVGLMEIQNNGETAVSYLVDQLNAAVGAGTYAYVPKPAATGTDAIRVAMIYKPSTLALVGGALSDADAINNRPPMAQTFQAANGGKFSLIVNHLKSKGSCGGASGGNADSGDGQSCWNATRVAQAQRLATSFIPQVASAAGDADVLVIGDMNAYGFEDPINVLTDTGMVNQLERFLRPHGIPHSYVFNSESGYLDHALASATLSAQVLDATEWNINADEPSVIDYNTDGKQQDLYTVSPYRASDHDPVLIALNLAPGYADVTSSFSAYKSGLVYNRMTKLYTASMTLTNTSGAAISGPFKVKLGGLPAGVTLTNASGSHAGTPYIALANASVAAGASITVPLTFANPNKVSIVFTPAIFTGNF